MKFKRQHLILIVALAIALLAFTGCMPRMGARSLENPAGFLMGIWHGWIAPLSLIIGIFNDNIRVYEVVNTGWFYDFGFYIAIISGFGGLSLSRKKKKKKD